MGRSMSLLSGGEEKDKRGGREGRGGKRRADLPLPFTQALGNFLIDFQGYVSNLFFRYGEEGEAGVGLRTRVPVNIFQAIFPKFGPARNDCASRTLPPPSPSYPLSLSLKRRKEVTFTPPHLLLKKRKEKRSKKKKSMCFQTGCVR